VAVIGQLHDFGRSYPPKVLTQWPVCTWRKPKANKLPELQSRQTHGLQTDGWAMSRGAKQQIIQKLWNLQGTDHFGQESVCDGIILKCGLKIIRRCELDSSGSVHDLREGRCGQASDSQLVTDAHRTHTEPGCVPVRICACNIRSDIRNGSATWPHSALLFTAVRPSVRTDVNSHCH
jgi:hypothetical protein